MASSREPNLRSSVSGTLCRLSCQHDRKAAPRGPPCLSGPRPSRCPRRSQARTVPHPSRSPRARGLRQTQVRVAHHAEDPLTPQFTSVSAMTSDVVLVASGSGSRQMRMRPSRTLPGHVSCTVSSWPPGVAPVIGSKSQPYHGQRLSGAHHCPSKCARQTEVVRSATVLIRPSGRSCTRPMSNQSRQASLITSPLSAPFFRAARNEAALQSRFADRSWAKRELRGSN